MFRTMGSRPGKRATRRRTPTRRQSAHRLRVINAQFYSSRKLHFNNVFCRFHDLAWTSLDDSYSRGVIAGALDNGSLDLWDAGKLLNGSSNGLISRSSKHTGAIKALQFNPKYTNLVATGGAKGEIYITDLNQVDAPIRLGSTAARADDIDCLDWNKKVSHIMVTGSAGGFVTVWDMKTRKESLTLNNYGRKPVSAVAWDPDKVSFVQSSTRSVAC